ncbi:MAG: N-acetylmuramoyl-L-alanine amidase, partial [Bacteroidota bacterium]
PGSTFSTDYGPALWNPTTCNYSSRNGTAVSAITIHTVQGSYAGCISWFKNCSSNVSAHYVIRSSDGQVTQMVLESNKAWHVGSENPYTIGYEHEGYVNDASWYTTAMYNSSADLSRDVINSGYGINGIRAGFWPWLATTYYNQSSIPGSCSRIKGHMHYPNQTHSDPGPNWNWDYYFKLINNNPTVTTLTAASGNLYDSGGAAGNYSNDERSVWVINPSGATSVTLTFSSFNVENTWDYLYIYDGNDVWSPLIGYYTGTTSPGAVTSSGGALTVEFRSDCATTAAGWNGNWTSTSGALFVLPILNKI